MNKLKKVLILIIVILTAVLAFLLYKYRPTNKELYPIEYTSVENLDNKGEPYYLLACDMKETQCQYILKAVTGTDRAKYDIYYIDTTFDIDLNEVADQENNLIYERLNAFGKLGIKNVPVIQLRVNGNVLAEKQGFYTEEYYKAVEENNKVPTGIVETVMKEYRKFVQKGTEQK